MSLISSICCVNCAQIYDESRKPCVGTCHDSVCQPCRQQMKVFTCPTCGKKDAFKEETVNWHGIQMQKDILKELTEDNIQEFIKKQKDKNSGPCQECGDFAKKLRICLECAAEQEVLIPRQEHFTINRKSDGTALGAFFKAKQFSICANCATDGEHAEHKCDLLASVYDESMVDKELDFMLRRVVHLKYEKELEEQVEKLEKQEEVSDSVWIPVYKQDLLKIEMFRQRRLDFQSGGESVSAPYKIMNPDILKQLREVMRELELYERKMQMMYVEEIQMRHADSEDEEIQKEIREVVEKMLKEEEKLSIEELAKVEEKVKERILKSCEEEEGTEDAFEKLEEARDKAQRLQNDWLNHPMKEVQIKVITAEEYRQQYGDLESSQMAEEFKELMKRQLEMTPHGLTEAEVSRRMEQVFESHKIVLVLGKEADELNREHMLAELQYYKVLTEASICDLAASETIDILEGRGRIQLEHPNLEKYLSMFQQQERFDKFYFSSVLRYS